MTELPSIVDGCRDLLARYDVLFCDVWGVVHDGRTAFAEANIALRAFRDNGGTVILVSNAPTPSANVARVLDEKGVDRAAWDAIVSSGDLALAHIRQQGWGRIHCIGPERRDRAFFEAIGSQSAGVEEAEAVACTGLVDDRKETAEDYRGRLQAALGRDLTLVCANPDLVVHVGSELLVCAGALGVLYEEMGGQVFWAGKPFPVAYATALEVAARIRGTAIMPKQVLAVGDSIRTDLAAAAGAGMDALFIASGIHRDEAMKDGAVSPAAMAQLFGGDGPPAIAAASALRL